MRRDKRIDEGNRRRSRKTAESPNDDVDDNDDEGNGVMTVMLESKVDLPSNPRSRERGKSKVEGANRRPDDFRPNATVEKRPRQRASLSQRVS